jgi:superfamily II DNA or RNA helicase
VTLSFEVRGALELRPYQQDALAAWSGAGFQGVVVLPTGAGKTAVGAAAIREAGKRTLVLVPTIDLQRQWGEALTTFLGVPKEQLQIGFPGDDGGTQLSLFAWEPPDILISTYSGATRNTEHLHHFGLLIFDEVHHLPAPVFRTIAELSPAEYRLGLTATPERYDQEEKHLGSLVGATVYRARVEELDEGYLAPHTTSQILVELDAEERARYDAGWKEYISYVRRARLRMPKGYAELIKRAGRDGAAKKALNSHRTARETALSASGKVRAVEDLLAYHSGERIIVFCQHVELAERIGRMLNLPVATHETPKATRVSLLAGFRSGEEPVLVATSILDEGVDVPDASVGIVVSGTGQGRQYIQRLGRILRPSPGKTAVLYEIVTRDTLEERTAARRRTAARKR